MSETGNLASKEELETSSKGLSDDAKTKSSEDAPTKSKPAKTHYPLSFWLAFAGLCFTGLVSALDGSVVSTALPSIIADLSGGDQYTWVVNVYFLTSAALQPLFGQLADLWGRRYVMIVATCIFLLGSGICGGSTSIDMLIVARAVQGIGAGGINMLIDMIICDLVPMRERGNFLGILFLFVSIGTTIGPLIGGILTDRTSWRWVFYINLPIGGAALLLLILFLQVKWKKEFSTIERLKRIDVIGNAILICSTYSILNALTYGGTKYSWSDGHVVAPLIVGLFGLIIFYLFELSPWCAYPVIPPHQLSHRTTAVALFISFMCMLLSFWAVYFYPVYFQSVRGSSPTRSGVQLIPFEVAFPVFAAVGGGLLTKIGRYKPLHMFFTGIVTLGVGLTSILGQNSNAATWAVFEILIGTGLGGMISTTLQAVQAGLPESEVASSTGTWSFIRSLGTIWGLSIPAAIFNNRIDQLSGELDPRIRDSFTHGQAYQHATAAFINSFDPQTRSVIVQVYVDALKRVWQISVVFAGIAFLSTLLEKEIPLRTEIETDFGLVDEKKSTEPEDEEKQVDENKPVDTQIVDTS
ncbi:MAG: hypothetical protein M1822_003253 [Bathelium mastoideum]|nr:MAG: hypothetical protein M1822_003253 [Bathelium mastoideum]